MISELNLVLGRSIKPLVGKENRLSVLGIRVVRSSRGGGESSSTQVVSLEGLEDLSSLVPPLARATTLSFVCSSERPR